jgi:proline iminopeptidase
MKLELDSGNNIFYDQWLDGETDLLILNGGPGLSYEIFESFKEHLRGENIRITVYDPLGYHHSDKPEGFDYSIDYYAEEVEEVRKKLNLHNTVIVGHSFGGAVAMNYLLKYQQKVAAALFVNPYISTEKYGQNADILLDKLPDDVRSEIQDLVAQDNFGEDMMTILYRVYKIITHKIGTFPKNYGKKTTWSQRLYA